METKLDIVRALSQGRSINFAKLLEAHGIQPDDQPAYFKRAEAMSRAMLKICNHYAKETGIDDRILFCAIASGMAMDGSLHGLISHDESEAIIAADHQLMMSGQTEHQPHLEN